MTAGSTGVFDVYTRQSTDEEWSVVERCMPEVHAQKMANGFLERGVQAKITPSDPAYRPSYDDSLVAIAGQLTQATAQVTEEIHRYIGGDRANGARVREGLRRVQVNARMLDEFFAQEGYPGDPGRGQGVSD